MNPDDLLRRRAPSWVRAWSDNDLHAVASRFDRQRRTDGLSDQQEWLWDAVISELEYRRRRAIRNRPLTACSCWWCCPPFPAEPELWDEDRPD